LIGIRARYTAKAPVNGRKAAREREVRPRHDESGRCESDVKDAGVAHCLKLSISMSESQVPDISTIKRAVREARDITQSFVETWTRIGYLDVAAARCRLR